MTMMVTSRPTYLAHLHPPRVGFTLTVIPPPSGPPPYLIHSKNRGALSIRDQTIAPTATASAPAFNSAGLSSSSSPFPVFGLQTVSATPVLPDPVLERLSDGGAVVTQETPDGDKIFRVECSADMITWEALDVIQSEEGEAEYYDPSASAMNRCFYRLVEIPPP